MSAATKAPRANSTSEPGKVRLSRCTATVVSAAIVTKTQGFSSVSAKMSGTPASAATASSATPVPTTSTPAPTSTPSLLRPAANMMARYTAGTAMRMSRLYWSWGATWKPPLTMQVMQAAAPRHSRKSKR